LLLQSTFAALVSKRLSRIKDYEVVTPTDQTSATTKRNLGFPVSSTFSFTGFGQSFELKLKQKQHFLSPKYVHETQRYDSSGKVIGQYYNNSLPGNCFYEGTVNGNPKTLAVASTCRGLKALFHHSDGLEYMIEPNDGVRRVDGSHILYRIDDVDADMTNFCGTKDHHQSPTSILKPGAKHPENKNKRGSKLYVELMIVNDYERFKEEGETVEQNSLDIANIVDSHYSSTAFGDGNTYNVVVCRQLTWQWGDPIQPTFSNNEVVVDGTNGLLNLFNNWMGANPPTPQTSYATQFDDHQLYSGYKFESTILGLAGVGTMCTGVGSGAICQTFNQPSDAHSATVSAHEMGHNFNMTHDGTPGSGAPCPAGEYIMSASVCSSCPPLTQFSSCSIGALYGYCTAGQCNCLSTTYPTTLWGQPWCGNGFLETGEQCDCGLLVPNTDGSYPTDCSARDPCCNGNTCQLLPLAKCSAMQPCCNWNCTIVSTPLQCHTPINAECDLPQYCNGVNASCPVDTYYASSKTCGPNGRGNCYLGNCIDPVGTCISLGYANTCQFALAENNGNPCGNLICSDSTGLMCTDSGQVMADGSPCAVERVCYQGNCVNPGVIQGLECVPATCTNFPNNCGDILSGCDSTTTISCTCNNGLPCDQTACTAGLPNIGGCFIATAAFGSEMNSNVWVLRTFRDNYLKGTYFGEMFIHTYYSYSPTIANWIAQNEFARQVTRFFLYPIIFLVQNFL
jgi:hypothetical protein